MAKIRPLHPNAWTAQVIVGAATVGLHPSIAYDGPCETPRQAGEAALSGYFDSFVYLFIRGDQLLYVGMTRNPWGRFTKHARKAPWWPAADRVIIFRLTEPTVYAVRRSALKLEALAIRGLHPLFNVAGVDA